MHRVLVIEDEPHVRSIISELLDELGYDVEVAENGDKGIKLFNEMGDFDLVISDIRMPKMDGNEVARYIRNSDKSGTLLVAMTGFSEELQPEMFDALLLKPFSLSDFNHTIRTFEKSMI